MASIPSPSLHSSVSHLATSSSSAGLPLHYYYYSSQSPDSRSGTVQKKEKKEDQKRENEKFFFFSRHFFFIFYFFFFTPTNSSSSSSSYSFLLQSLCEDLLRPMGEPGGSSLFETYESEYNTLGNSLSRKINSQIPGLSGGEKKKF